MSYLFQWSYTRNLSTEIYIYIYTYIIYSRYISIYMHNQIQVSEAMLCIYMSMVIHIYLDK